MWLLLTTIIQPCSVRRHDCLVLKLWIWRFFKYIIWFIYTPWYVCYVRKVRFTAWTKIFIVYPTSWKADWKFWHFDQTHRVYSAWCRELVYWRVLVTCVCLSVCLSLLYLIELPLRCYADHWWSTGSRNKLEIKRHCSFSCRRCY